MSQSRVTIYSNGVAKSNPSMGGWAAILVHGKTQKEISGNQLDTSNNLMELTAAVMALEALKTTCDIDFYTNSEYVKNGVTLLLPQWSKNGWRTSEDKPVPNQDLWKRLQTVAQPHTINWNG